MYLKVTVSPDKVQKKTLKVVDLSRKHYRQLLLLTYSFENNNEDSSTNTYPCGFRLNPRRHRVQRHGSGASGCIPSLLKNPCLVNKTVIIAKFHGLYCYRILRRIT